MEERTLQTAVVRKTKNVNHNLYNRHRTWSNINGTSTTKITVIASKRNLDQKDKPTKSGVISVVPRCVFRIIWMTLFAEIQSESVQGPKPIRLYSYLTNTKYWGFYNYDYINEKETSIVKDG